MSHSPSPDEGETDNGLLRHHHHHHHHHHHTSLPRLKLNQLVHARACMTGVELFRTAVVFVVFFSLPVLAITHLYRFHFDFENSQECLQQFGAPRVLAYCWITIAMLCVYVFRLICYQLKDLDERRKNNEAIKRNRPRRSTKPPDHPIFVGSDRLYMSSMEVMDCVEEHAVRMRAIVAVFYIVLSLIGWLWMGEAQIEQEGCTHLASAASILVAYSGGLILIMFCYLLLVSTPDEADSTVSEDPLYVTVEKHRQNNLKYKLMTEFGLSLEEVEDKLIKNDWDLEAAVQACEDEYGSNNR